MNNSSHRVEWRLIIKTRRARLVLLKETKRYGTMEGVFRKFERIVTSYKGLTALIISLVTIIVALLGKGLL
jgi:hypothetical protein